MSAFRKSETRAPDPVLVVKPRQLRRLRTGRLGAKFGAILLLSACSESSFAPATDTLRSAAAAAVAPPGTTASFENRDRVAVRLQATGAFTPGTAITLTSEVHGLRGTASSKLAIYAQHAASVAGRASRETTQEISVAAGSDKSHSTVVTFAEPGYYPVSASVSTIAPQELDQDRALGVPVSSVITSNRWILIDEKGGRIDEEYDHSILEGTTRYLTNGSVGAFRSKPNARASSVSMVTARSAGASLLSPTDFNGRITYQRRLIGQSNTTEGVAGARVYGYCASVDDDPVGYFDIAADAQGAKVSGSTSVFPRSEP